MTFILKVKRNISNLIYIYIYIYIHTYLYIDRYTYTQIYIYIYIYIYVCVCVCVWEREREREIELTNNTFSEYIGFIWLYLNSKVHYDRTSHINCISNTHTHTHTHTQSQTHIYINTQIFSLVASPFESICKWMHEKKKKKKSIQK